MSSDWPVVEKFLSPDEVADDLFAKMKDAEGAAEFVNNETIEYHHSLGRDVRNDYWLWHPENPHTMKGYAPELRDGVDYSPRHPDSVSDVILKKLQDKIEAYRANL